MARRQRGLPINGWLVLDKPAGLTSTQALGRVRRCLNARKLGHGGTLDPLATGILPIALGEATKTVAYALEGEKHYRFTLKWGERTDTDDCEGKIVETSDRRPSHQQVEAVLPRFTGLIEQRPPAYSAIKVEGRRAYDLARAEEDFDLATRQIQVHSIHLTDHNTSLASFDVRCGKGTYMRALARDLGEALGTLAHIVALRRLAVGPFDESHAISLESLEALGHSAAASQRLLPVEAALDGIPALTLTEEEAGRLRRGQAVSMLVRAKLESLKGLASGSIVCAMSRGKPVALTRYEAGDLHPFRVLNL